MRGRGGEKGRGRQEAKRRSSMKRKKETRQKTKDTRPKTEEKSRSRFDSPPWRSERSGDSALAEGGEGVIDLNPLLGGVGVGFLRPKNEDLSNEVEIPRSGR